MDILTLGESNIDRDSEVKLVKGTRGLGIFVEQTLHYTFTSPPTEQTFSANKALSHEQAIELRDYLISNYPLEKKMNIYHLSSMKVVGYDMYDSVVVVANNKKEAVRVANKIGESGQWHKDRLSKEGKYTGDCTEPFILISSFNAGWYNYQWY